MDIKRMMGGALKGAPMQQQMPQQQPQKKKTGFGDVLSDFVINYGAAAGNPLASGIIQSRLAQQQQQAQQAARERLYERKRADGREDKQWEWDNKPESSTALQKDYEYLKGMNPNLAEQFLENRATAPPVVMQNPDGTRTLYPAGSIPRSGTPTSPVGKLRPIGATTQNTPAPQLGANGMPQMLSRQQYMATVNAMGKEKTDAWIARNNIQVGAQ